MDLINRCQCLWASLRSVSLHWRPLTSHHSILCLLAATVYSLTPGICALGMSALLSILFSYAALEILGPLEMMAEIF